MSDTTNTTAALVDALRGLLALVESTPGDPGDAMCRAIRAARQTIAAATDQTPRGQYDRHRFNCRRCRPGDHCLEGGRLLDMLRKHEEHKVAGGTV